MAKHFFNKLLNADDAPNLVDPSEVLNLENFRFGTSDSGEIAGLESVRATYLRYQPVVLYSDETPRPHTCIGAVADEANRYIVWFVHTPAKDTDPAMDFIYLHDLAGENTHLVLNSVVATLNFNPQKPIHSAVIANNCLYWTDDYNPPRMIHLGAGIKLMNAGATPIPCDYSLTAPLSEWDISLVKTPYPFAPKIEKDTDSGYALNRIKNEDFKFAVRYIYYNGEKSVLSAWSKSSKLNGKEDNRNIIKVSIDKSEKIPQGVRIVQFVAQYGSTYKAFVVKSFDRMVAADATAISAHNTATTALGFSFYNRDTGEALDDAETVQPFHSVPLLTRTLELCKNRLFLANNLEGYDTPKSTSLQVQPVASQISGSSTTVNAQVGHTYGYDEFTDQYDCRSFWMVYLANVAQPGWYILYSTQVTNISTGSISFLPPLSLPASVVMADLTYVTFASGSVDVLAWDGSSVLTVTDTPALAAAASTQFKGGGEYMTGVVFYDKALRKSGVVKSSRVAIQERNYDFTDRVPALQFTLNNASAAAEIPSWAHYYSVVRTLNLKTRSFVQGIGGAAYFKKDTTGSWVTTGSSTFDAQTEAVALDISPLVQWGLGYSFNEGDVCYLIKGDDTRHELPIIDTYSNNVLLQAKDLGSLAGVTLVYEIYTPYKPVSNEPFYEVGYVYPVANPGQGSRSYSVTSDVLEGDVFVLQRTRSGTNYMVEAMCPNDRYWKRWDTDAGRINIVTSRGVFRNKTGLRFSNTFIPGTDTNGLSAFEALNQTTMPIEMNEAQRLILTSPYQSEGTVMLCVGTSETVSIYIGQSKLADETNNTTLIRTNGVIGAVDPLKGSLGTLHPESVARRSGRVFWLDILNGVIAAYSANGLFAQSSYKLRRATKLACERLKLMPLQVIPGGFDPFHGEYLLSMPKTENTPPKGLLAPYATEYSPYDFYDGVAKTWVAKVDSDRFMGSYRFVAEYFVSCGEALFSFNSGALWEHNRGAGYNSFYGQTVKPSLAFVENGAPDSQVKLFKSIALEASATPELTHIRTETDGVSFYEQSSDLVAADWAVKEGVRRASILRDMLSPNTPGTSMDKLLKGDTMRGQFARIFMRFSGSGKIQVRFVNVNYNASMGHPNI